MLFNNNVIFSVLKSNNSVINNSAIHITYNKENRVKFPVLGCIILVIIAFDYSF